VRRRRTGPQHQASWAVPCRSGEAVQPGSACRRSALPAAPAQSDGPRTPFLERSSERRPFPMPRPARRPSRPWRRYRSAALQSARVIPCGAQLFGQTPASAMWGEAPAGPLNDGLLRGQTGPTFPNAANDFMACWFWSKTAELPKTRARAWRSRRGATTAPRARQAARRLSAEDLPVLRSATMSKETFCPSLRLLIPARSTALM
jgi:hypothetical protein